MGGYLRGRTAAGASGSAPAADADWKQSVVVATTVAGTLATSFAAGQTVDGVVLTTGMRILIKDQVAGAENGIYVVNASGAPSRASDGNSGADLVSAACFVERGTTNADRAFVCSNDSVTLGSTAIVFVGFASLVGALLKASNLSDLASVPAARTSLGLGTLAVQDETALALSYGIITAAQVATWRAQATWSIDESNVSGLASDANTGIDDTHPLRTIGEFVRRMTSTGRVNATIIYTVRWMSNAVTTNIDLSLLGSMFGARLEFKGIPTVVQSGTLTSGTAAGSGNTAPIVEDTALASTWAAAGGISSSSGGRMIRKVGGAVRGWVSKDLGSKQARVSWPCNVAETTNTASPSAASFVSGDAYEVVSLPTFPSISATDLSTSYLRFLLLHITSVSGSSATAGSLFFNLCSFQLSAIPVVLLGANFYACCAMGGFFSKGPGVSLRFCLFSGTVSLTAFPTAQTFVNTFQAANLLLGIGCDLANTATWHFYDSPAIAIQLQNGARIGLAGVAGSGNVGAIISLDHPGCKVYSRDSFATMTATTAAAKPLSLLGTAYDYADAISGIAVNDVKDAGFYGGAGGALSLSALAATALLKANNLSDLSDAVAARANLGALSLVFGPDIDLFAAAGTTWQWLPAQAGKFFFTPLAFGMIVISKTGTLTGVPSFKLGTNVAHDNHSNPLNTPALANMNACLVGETAGWTITLVHSVFRPATDFSTPLVLEMVTPATGAGATFVVRPSIMFYSGPVP